MSRKIRIAVAVLAFAFSVAFLWYQRSDLRLAAETSRILDSAEEGGVRDLSPVESLLSREWKRSPRHFSNAFDLFFEWAETRKIPLRPESVLNAFEASHPGFCRSFEWSELSERLGTYCERSALPLPKLPRIAEKGWTPPDCDAYVRKKNRQACLVAVNGVFSAHSDSHCSDSACKNDQSAFRALVFSTDAVEECARRPSDSLRKECADFVALAVVGFSGSGGELGGKIRSSISGTAEDPVSQAVRRAVFSDDSSPSEECSKVPLGEVEKCETMAKAAFEHVESERLGVRIARIRSAASEYSSAR